MVLGCADPRATVVKCLVTDLLIRIPFRILLNYVGADFSGLNVVIDKDCFSGYSITSRGVS